jgi:tetratricopeptide (TPR) repeat protein
VAQLANAGCAALSYYTGMLFRYRVLVLAAGSMLVAGCHAPGGSRSDPPRSAVTLAAAVRRLPTDDAEVPALSLTDSNDLSGSNEDLESVIEAHAHYGAGVVHEMNLEPESALEDYYKAATLDPTNAALVLEVSQQFLEAKEPDKALELLKSASTNASAPSMIFAQLGFVYSKLGRTNEAIAADRAAIQKDPRSLAGYQSLFIDYLQNNQIAQIVPLLEEAAKVKGTDAEFLIGLAELYIRLGVQTPTQKKICDEHALSALQRAAKQNPSDAPLQMHLADGFNLLGKTDEAARIYENLAKQIPDDSPQADTVRAKLADIYLHNHDLKHAAEQLEVILRDNPTDAQTYYILGGIAYDETNYVKASDYFREAISVNPDLESAYFDLARAQLGLNKPAEALGTLENGNRRFPQNFTGEYLTAVAYNEQKDYTNALHHFTAAEVVAEGGDPKRVSDRLTDEFYFQVGATCERLGDYTQAEKYFEKSLQLSPDSPETLNYLGYMWAEHDRKLDQAHDMIAKAVKAEPKNSAYLDSMAWVLYKLHQPKPALDYELKSIQLEDEEDATVYDHLGDIYAALGEKDKAREAWTKSLKLEKSDAVQKKLQSESE